MTHCLSSTYFSLLPLLLHMLIVNSDTAHLYLIKIISTRDQTREQGTDQQDEKVVNNLTRYQHSSVKCLEFKKCKNLEKPLLQHSLIILKTTNIDLPSKALSQDLSKTRSIPFSALTITERSKNSRNVTTINQEKTAVSKASISKKTHLPHAIVIRSAKKSADNDSLTSLALSDPHITMVNKVFGQNILPEIKNCSELEFEDVPLIDLFQLKSDNMSNSTIFINATNQLPTGLRHESEIHDVAQMPKGRILDRCRCHNRIINDKRNYSNDQMAYPFAIYENNVLLKHTNIDRQQICGCKYETEYQSSYHNDNAVTNEMFSNMILEFIENTQGDTNDTIMDENDARDLIGKWSDCMQSLRKPLNNVTRMVKFKVPYRSLRPTFMNDFQRRTSTRIVSILGLFELSVGSKPRVYGQSELAAARLAVRHVNERQVLPGYTLQLISNDTQCDPGVGVDRFFHALYTGKGSKSIVLLGTACSEVTETLAKIVPYWNMVQVSFGAVSPALSDRGEYPLFFRTVAPDTSHNAARVAFIRNYGWDTVTTFSQNEEEYSLAVNLLLADLEAANITCSASITFARQDFQKQMLQLKETDTRIIIASFAPDLTSQIFCEAYSLGLVGENYAWLVGGRPVAISHGSCPKETLQDAMEGALFIHAYDTALNDSPSYSIFNSKMLRDQLKLSSVPISPFAPQSYDAVWAIALALAKAEESWRHQSEQDTGKIKKRKSLSYFDYDREDMMEDLMSQLEKTKFIGVSGPVSFNGADRVGITAFYQIRTLSPVLVGLYSEGRALECRRCERARWGSGEAVPIARRRLRVRVDAVWAPARLAGAALAGAGTLLASAFLVFNLRYGKRRWMKLSSPKLNNMTSAGCMLVYAAVALRGLDHASLPAAVPFNAMCTARVYILSAGFSLAFGSMFAKTYRVHRIFISGVCKTKLLRDLQLIALVCALLVIDGFIVTLWTVMDPMQRQLKNLTLEISATDRSVVFQPQVEICESHNTAGWLCALYAYKGLLLLVGVYMAWETRGVKISALNDSKYIGISVYLVVLTSASVVVLGTLLSEKVTLAYVTITSLILLSTTSTLCLLFVPKIFAIKQKCEDDQIIRTMGLKLECNTRRFVTDDKREQQFRVEIQNKVYKRDLVKLDKEIARLEKLLNGTKEEATTSHGSPTTAAVHMKATLAPVNEESQAMRTSAVSGGLPMLLLSASPPIIPRASWPSITLRSTNSITFGSQLKLDRKSQLNIDRKLPSPDYNHVDVSLFKWLKNIFGSKSNPSSRKASAVSIADPTTQRITGAFKMHVGVIKGLVPQTNKKLMGSCDAVHDWLDTKLRKESFTKSGPITAINDGPSTSYDPEAYISSSEPKVNFLLPQIHATSHSLEKVKGSTRFPHKISPKSTIQSKKPITDSIYTISGKMERRKSSCHNINEPKMNECRSMSVDVHSNTNIMNWEQD